MNNAREPLIHISKRSAVPWYTAWIVRGCAVLLALVLGKKRRQVPDVGGLIEGVDLCVCLPPKPRSHDGCISL